MGPGGDIDTTSLEVWMESGRAAPIYLIKLTYSTRREKADEYMTGEFEACHLKISIVSNLPTTEAWSVGQQGRRLLFRPDPTLIAVTRKCPRGIVLLSQSLLRQQV